MSQSSNSEPKPTRPDWKWLVVIVAALIVVGAADNWSKVSTFAHLPQIEHNLGIG